ncbi:MFS monocarboxylate transporter [Metarhizium album ARSEF 1941]|uniref:MFS monocarboxylate transporter n=1 Tax=Metarhizium album (strain ARSEF 1941) TaxID=1081103 RepID=A0A0B2WND1_METAS|nr:MFS monocarboxylate transporter [Metarhizium album ARSEF 1941]KHN94997.1 MFS monocarboxylate transporter [Metarhizium album ARSEF 1941]
MGSPPSLTDEEDKDDISMSFPDEEKDDLWKERNPFLRPADHGSHAWLFLAASFMIEGLALGKNPSKFCVCHKDVADQTMKGSPVPMEFSKSTTVHTSLSRTPQVFPRWPPVPWQVKYLPNGGCVSFDVLTVVQGIMYLGMPITMGVQRLYPRLSIWSPLAGVLIMCTSLVAASFSTSVPHLVLTQGLLFAIGSSLSYCPCIAYLNEWFDKRKGMAYGIMWAGTGLSGSILPFLLEYLLGRFGFETTLRFCAVGLLPLTLPLVYFIKPRIPPQLVKKHLNPFNFRFAFSQTFVLHMLANIVQALGFFLPSIYLPTYARGVLGSGEFPAAATVLLLNLASTVGCPGMGWLSDNLHVANCLFIATAGASLATFLIWGFTTSIALLLTYCGFYGLFAGSYTSAWTGLMRQVTTEKSTTSKETDPVMVMAVLAAGRGIGSVLSGPLSQALVDHTLWKGEAYAAYGTGYGPLIVFTGVTAAAAGVVLPWRYMGWIR